MTETPSLPQMPKLSDADLEHADPRFLEALSSLNEIGAAVNRLTPSGHSGVEDALRLIVESAMRIAPDATAVIYTYDVDTQAFDLASRVSAGELANLGLEDQPRPAGIGMQAIHQRRRMISYEEPSIEMHPARVAEGVRTMACFPLVVAGQPVGALYVYLRRDRHFSRFELLLLDGLVNQAAMAIYQARRLSDMERDLVRTEDALDRLWRAGMLISSRLGLEETLGAILQMALDVTRAHHGIFRLVDASGTRLVTRAIAGAAGRPQVGALSIDGSSIMGWVAAHREPLCIHDLSAAPWVRLYHPLDADLRMRSELAVPLIGSSGRLEGVLNLESPIVGAFGDNDRHLLQSLATQAVIAIQEARLLDALLEAARLVLIEPYHKVLQYLVTQAADLLNAAASAIWMLEGDELVLQATTEGLQRGERLPLEGSLTGQAVFRRQPVTSQDVREDERFYRLDLARSQAWTRALVVPLLSSDDGVALGAFSVYGVQGDPGQFTESEWDKKVLTCLAYYAALAHQNANRQRALRQAQERHAVAETFAAVGDVAANVLHHLNNKVGTIPVRIQGIQDKCQSSLAADDYLNANLAEIERSAREAMAAVRDSLVHLRPIHLAPVHVAACVETALGEASLSPDIQVEVTSLQELPPVIASERGLAFVFANLVDNAAAALAGHGTINICGYVDGPWVEVRVADDGPGIAAELHGRIFEFDPSGTDARRHGKLGFGLWWAKTLLVRLGGSISVHSDGASGTTFRVRLPRAEPEHG